MPKPTVARIWQGRTRAAIAATYADYLYESGVKKLRSTNGNLGVQVFRQVRDGVASFMTISYWASRDQIRAYAGENIEQTRHLPRDAEYLLELPPSVQHFDIVISEWPRTVANPKRKAAARKGAKASQAKRRIAGYRARRAAKKKGG